MMATVLYWKKLTKTNNINISFLSFFILLHIFIQKFLWGKNIHFYSSPLLQHISDFNLGKCCLSSGHLDTAKVESSLGLKAWSISGWARRSQAHRVCLSTPPGAVFCGNQDSPSPTLQEDFRSWNWAQSHRQERSGPGRLQWSQEQPQDWGLNLMAIRRMCSGLCICMA